MKEEGIINKMRLIWNGIGGYGVYLLVVWRGYYWEYSSKCMATVNGQIKLVFGYS